MEELYKKTLDRLKAELKKQLTEIEANGDWLWHHPEAGFKETETQKYCLEVLKNHGFEACTWPDVTGFTCTYDTGRPGPCVMIMGEMDSLICYSHPDCNPETGAAHACGHSIQVATAMGAFITLTESGVLENFGGKVMLAGVPAEECLEIEGRTREIQKTLSSPCTPVWEMTAQSPSLAPTTASSPKMSHSRDDPPTRQRIRKTGSTPCTWQIRL